MPSGKPFVPKRGQRDQVQLRKAAGWNHAEIAAELGIDRKTLYLHFGDEILTGGAKKRGQALDLLWKSAKEGNVAAQKAVVAMMIGQPGEVSEGEHTGRNTSRSPTLGKKELANQEAQTAGVGTEWGDDLMPVGSAKPN